MLGVFALRLVHLDPRSHPLQAAKPEVYVSHYERITGSSAGFNQTIKEIGGTRRALGSSVRNMTADDRGLWRGSGRVVGCK